MITNLILSEESPHTRIGLLSDLADGIGRCLAMDKCIDQLIAKLDTEITPDSPRVLRLRLQTLKEFVKVRSNIATGLVDAGFTGFDQIV